MPNLARHLGLDAAYTRVPAHTRRRPDVEGDDHVVFQALAALTYPAAPSDPAGAFPLMWTSPLGKTLPPGAHMACFDTLYYATSGRQDFEWFHAWCPPWRRVGRYLFFTDELTEMAGAYLRRVLGLSAMEELRPVRDPDCHILLFCMSVFY